MLLALQTVASAQTLSGTVTDLDTGRRIESFKVIYATSDVISPNRLLSMAGKVPVEGKSGKYECALTSRLGQRQMIVRFEAEGYLPVLSPVIGIPLGRTAVSRWSGRCVVDTVLKRTPNVTGTVRLASGDPASGAQVIVAVPELGVVIENGQIQAQRRRGMARNDTAQVPPHIGVRSVVVDATGRFSIAPDREGFVLLVLHEQGFARMDNPAAKDQSITLEPWGVVTGSAERGGATVAMELSSDDPSTRFLYEASADELGKFKFSRVAAGEYRMMLTAANKSFHIGPGEALEAQRITDRPAATEPVP
jgi:hypothetical protein